MKKLIELIQKSIFDPDFYHDVLGKPLSFSWKYFTAFALLLSVFLTIVISIPLVADANRIMHEVPPKFFAYFPDDFELRATNGKMTVNQQEPYFFEFPAELGVPLEPGIRHVAVVDTKTSFTVEQFRAYESAFWVGESQIAYQDRNGSIKIETLPVDATFVVNETEIRRIIALVSPYTKYLGPAIVLFLFIGITVSFGVQFIYLLFGALAILVLAHLMKKPLSYGKAYQVGLHAMTLPLLVSALLAMLPFTTPTPPFLQTALLLVVVYLNLRTRVVVPPPAPSVPPSATSTLDATDGMKD